MQLTEISENLVQKLVRAPEAGMGYQQGKLVGITGIPVQGFFLNCGYFTPAESPDLRGTGSATDFSKLLLLESPQPEKLQESGYGFQQPRIQLQSPASASATSLSATAAPSATLPPHTTTTSATDVFYRVSAFRADRRVLPNGSLARQSYATTDTDITVVPSGLAAVGRYAVPTRISARYLFEIKPGAGVVLLFGTVTPNFGLAGGGVEVFFPNGTNPGTVTYLHALPEK